MRKILALASAAGLLGAAGFVAWFSSSRPQDAFLTAEAAHSFDLDRPTPAPPAPAANDELRDAVAAPASPLPIPLAGMSFGAPPGDAAPAAPREPVPPAAPPARVAWARRSRALAALLRAPMRVMLGESALRSPRALRAFLRDPRRVDAYLDEALVRVALNSPVVAKIIVGRPALVMAFLASPAMRDASAVRELLASPMTRKILDCPGVQAALADPTTISRLAQSPEAARWLAENPAALRALAFAAPGLAGAFGAR